MKKKLSILLSFCLFSLPGIGPAAPVFAQCNFGGPPPKEEAKAKEGEAPSKDKKQVGDSAMPKGELPKAYQDRNQGLKEAQNLDKEQAKVQQAISANQQLAAQAAAAGDQNSAATARSNIAGLRGLQGSLRQKSAAIRPRIQRASAVIDRAAKEGKVGVSYGNVQARPLRGIAPKGRKRPQGPIFFTPWQTPQPTYTAPAEPQRFHEVTAGPIGADMSLATPVGGCGGIFIGPADAKIPPNSILNVGDCKTTGASTCNMQLDKGGAMIDNTKPPDTSTGTTGGDITPTEPPSGGGGPFYRPLEGNSGGGGGGGGGGKSLAKMMAIGLVIGAAGFMFTRAKVVAKKEKDGGGSLVVLDGEVKAVDKDGKNEMILKPGQAIRVGPDGKLPEEAKKVNLAKLNRWWEEKGSKEKEKAESEEDAETAELKEEEPGEEDSVLEEKAEKAEKKRSLKEKGEGKGKSSEESSKEEEEAEPKKPAKKKGVRRAE